MTHETEGRSQVSLSHETIEDIKGKLRALENQEDIKILYAAESGSRAWGFASPDSDFDVRFIYVRRPEYYLKLEKTRDVVEWQSEDKVFDFAGWDLQKTLRLLHGSNPSLFEWLASPLVYIKGAESDAIREKSTDYFNPKTLLHHYLSMAHNNFRDYFGHDKVKLKKYFYVLRPILASKWILANETYPPIVFSELVEYQLEDHLRPIVNNLLDRKMYSAEFSYGDHISELDDYFEHSMPELTEKANSFSGKEHNSGWGDLDLLFRTILSVWGKTFELSAIQYEEIDPLR